MIVYGRNSSYEILKNCKSVKKVYLDRKFSDKTLISLIEKLKIEPKPDPTQ